MFEKGDTIRFVFKGEKFKGKVIDPIGLTWLTVEMAKGVEMTIGKEWVIE